MISSTTSALEQKRATLHLLSNFAAGQADWNPYWRQHITSLEQQALPFRYEITGPAPFLILDEGTSLALSSLFSAAPEELDYWPTWCTFISLEQKLSETFLLLSIIAPTSAGPDQQRQKHLLSFRFQHDQHLPLLEAIAETEQVFIRSAYPDQHLSIPLYDPELFVHLHHIRPLFS